MVTDDELWRLLRSLYDPDHLERPPHLDVVETRDRFERLVARLNAEFDCTCLAEREVEDASLHARVEVPAEATESGEPLVVCVSNFGNLAAVSVTNPGVWSHAEMRKLLGDDADRIFGVLDALNYIVVPEEPLWRDYDGPSLLSTTASTSRVTWWTRYFDYV